MSNKLMKCKTCKAEIAKSAKVCPSCGAKNKKPLYKNWLAWAAALIVIITIASNSSNNTTNTQQKSQAKTDGTTQTKTGQTTTAATTEQTKAIKDGQYKVGQDIPAGEYVLVTKLGKRGGFQISKDSTGNNGSVVFGDSVRNRRYILLDDGQYIKVSYCEMYKLNDAPKAELVDGYFTDGIYKVGVDFPAGEHKVIGMGEECGISVYSNPRGAQSLVSADLFKGEKYITLKDGQYLDLTNAKIK